MPRNGTPAPSTIIKTEQFEAFLKAIEESVMPHWVDIARALNVEEDTITAWKKRPEAQLAIKKGIEHALKCMEQAGARDWRMWEKKLKLLGVDAPDKVEANLRIDPRSEILKRYGLKDAGETEEAESRPPTDTA